VPEGQFALAAQQKKKPKEQNSHAGFLQASVPLGRGEARANLWGVHHCTIFTVSMMIY